MDLIKQKTPWFWDTPEGGGWACYLSNGDYVDQYSLPGRADRESDPDQAAEYRRLLECLPNRQPTRAERSAWRRINPPADGQEEGD